MNLNLKSFTSKNKNKLIKKINFFQNKIDYDDIMSYADNSYEYNSDEIILHDDIFMYSDEKLNDDFNDDTLFY